LACLLLLRATSQQLVEVVPTTHRAHDQAYTSSTNTNTTLSLDHGVDSSGSGVSASDMEMLRHSLYEGVAVIVSAFGTHINYDFLFW
jgi:hypothetical protein